MVKRQRINPYSKKRTVQLREYKLLCDEMDSCRPHICWFCNKVMSRPESHHHSMGRDGDYYLAKEHLKHAHETEHNMYHFGTLKQLLETTWYVDWLNRQIEQQILWHEEQKFYKNNLNPKDYGINVFTEHGNV